MKKMTVLDVYYKTMEQGRYEDEQYEKGRGKGIDGDDTEAASCAWEKRQCFYQVAMWLEQTEEVNPTVQP